MLLSENLEIIESTISELKEDADTLPDECAGSPSKMWNSKPGLQWQDAGKFRSKPDSKPDGWPGKELTNPKLATALNKAEFENANKVQFTMEEMDAFGLDDLGDGIFFVKSDDKIFESKALPTMTKLEVVFFFFGVGAIVKNIPKSLVAFVGIGTFYMFMVLLYFRFYLSVIMSCLICKAESELNKQKEAQETGKEQRGVFQVCTRSVFV